jgi:myosin heavy subunit
LCTHKQAAALEQRRALDQLGGPLTDNDALVPLSETLQEITALQGIQQDRRNAINEAEEAASELRKGQAKLNQMRDDANKLSAEADRLFQQLEKIKAERDLLQEKIKRSGEIVDALAEQADAATAHIETLPDVSPRIAALQSSIATAESTNKALAKRQALQEEHKRLDLEAEAAKLHHEHLDGIVDRLRDMRRHLLDGVDLGCDGLQIGDGELLLNGVTFKQASQAERLRVALAVSMRQNPRLRLLRIDGGEQLDSASRQLVLSTARERDYQVIMATVSDGEKLAVEIVEE